MLLLRMLLIPIVLHACGEFSGFFRASFREMMFNIMHLLEVVLLLWLEHCFEEGLAIVELAPCGSKPRLCPVVGRFV